MSQELDFSEFRRVFENLDRVKDQIPEIKREFLDSLGRRMLSSVRWAIGGEGKVQSWQEYSIGSRGGYAAVRPKENTYQNSSKREYSVGFITTKIENGHRIRSPSGQAKGSYRYRGDAHKANRIPGRYFYKDSQAAVDNFAKAGKELADKIAQTIEREIKK